jgi:hypothetical protein
MARLASVAIGGYFPTPRHLIPRIAPLVSAHLSDEARVSYLDPCAGDGEAILALLKLTCKSKNYELFACEMESSRFEALQTACSQVSYALRKDLIEGDAFCATFKRESGISLLYLNPPYDFDRVHGRLENKFLQRFTETLAYQGVLLFVVPYYALKSSAQELATHYDNVSCFKFPDKDFATFKQVVLFATRVEQRLQPNVAIQAQVERYAAGEDLRELPYFGAKPLAVLPSTDRYSHGLSNWAQRPVDVAGLLKKITPWSYSGRNGARATVPGILPDLPLDQLMLRTYPVATPPRPAHIASGIASGIFNGSMVKPDDKKLPALLVKGVFNQEYRTVEEKTNKDGDVTGLIQVQQPKLVVTVLDLTTYRYHKLGNDGNFTGAIETLSVSSLLKHYGTSLMRVMEEQCPVLYDPRRDRHLIPLAPTARQPFTAQADAARALVALLGGPGLSLKQRQGKSGFLLGEIGSGKSTVALVVSKTVGAKRPLIICPPHLLKSWADEIAAVLPQAQIRVLTTITDLESLASDSSEQTIISVLSRETAKLGHGWESVGDVCPKCGALTPRGEDHAKKRSRCKAQSLIGRGPIGSAVRRFAHYLKRYRPKDDTLANLLRGRWDVRSIEWHKDHEQEFEGLPAGFLDETIQQLKGFVETEGYADEPLRRALGWCLVAAYDESKIADLADFFLSRSPYSDQEYGRQLLYLLRPGSERQTELVERRRKTTTSYYSPWVGFEKSVEDAQKGSSYIKLVDLVISWEGFALTVGGVEPNSLEASCRALRSLTARSGLYWGKECGEFLFQAVPEPRRVALAKHIQDRFKHTFDFLVLDEAHEYSSDLAAQTKSAQRLIGLKLPTILMTGSVMNGYAESLFMSMWACSPAFRDEFSRDDKQRFIDRYGYRKRLLTDRKEDDEASIAFGSMSDRVTTTSRIIGNAPGILPLFLLRHLLPISVTLHKSDLALDLPECIQERHLIEPDPELKRRYDTLKAALAARIKKDQFDSKLAGKLFGQLAELPSYLDRATNDTGNNEHGDYSIRYPESVGGDVVATQPGLPADSPLNKERWMLECVERELAEGRNVMVFSWHVSLLPRIAGLLSELVGKKVPILYADKVPTGKRQEWISKNVVAKNARVMVCNPVVVQTGLNNLVHFSTEIWLENPMCNPIVYRQATGRVDRIGQEKETRILFPIYKGTLQEQLHDLLMHKVTVSTATDGLDPESSLLASGVGPDDFLTGLSIGKQLWAMMSQETSAAPVKRVSVRQSSAVAR